MHPFCPICTLRISEDEIFVIYRVCHKLANVYHVFCTCTSVILMFIIEKKQESLGIRGVIPLAAFAKWYWYLDNA